MVLHCNTFMHLKQYIFQTSNQICYELPHKCCFLCTNSVNKLNQPVCGHWCFYGIYIYAFSRRFYPKRLTLHSSYSFTFDQLLLSLGIEPMILALLAPCSTIWATGKPVHGMAAAVAAAVTCDFTNLFRHISCCTFSILLPLFITNVNAPSSLGACLRLYSLQKVSSDRNKWMVNF